MSTGGIGNAGGTGGESGAAATGGEAGPGGNSDVLYDVLVNPYGTSPLVAVVNLRGIEADEVVTINVAVAGRHDTADFVQSYVRMDGELPGLPDTSDLVFPEPGLHVPVWGLYADTESDVQIHVDHQHLGDLRFGLEISAPLQDSAEPAWVPGILVRKADSGRMEPGWTVAEISIEPNPAPPVVIVDWTRTIAFDEYGAIRWALRLDDLPRGETFTLTRSSTGNILTGSHDTIVEVTKLGRVASLLELSEHTIHHEILQIGSGDTAEGPPAQTPDESTGNLLVLASKNGASTVQDQVIELDPRTGKVQNEWNLATILDPDRTTFIDPEVWAPGVGDWFHANGLAYSAVDRAIVVSGRHQGVAKFSRNGSLVWLLSPHEGWEGPQSEKLLLAVDSSGTPYEQAVQLGHEAAGGPEAPEFDWAFGQHSPALLPNGDLLLFDNGVSRHFGDPYVSTSRAVIFRIDETAMTVRQIAQFALTRAESSFFVSNTHLLPQTGNIFIQPGGSARNPAVAKEVATQVTSDGSITFSDVVFDAAIDLSFADPSRSYVYSYRGHRWTF